MTRFVMFSALSQKQQFCAFDNLRTRSQFTEKFTAKSKANTPGVLLGFGE